MAAVFVFAALVAVSVQRADASLNGVGQLPVMGWSGYNAFMQNSGHCDKAGAGGYNETTFVESMDALGATGLQKLGYTYLNADDCWIAEDRDAAGKLAADPTRFPHGMAWLAHEAHKRGLKLGLYAAASLETCRQFPGSQGHEAVDAVTFADWGADFAKLDSCGGVLNNGTEAWEHQYGGWAKALNATGRPVVFSCSWAVYFTLCAAHYPPTSWEKECGRVPWQDGYIGSICHLWRYGQDLDPVWTTGQTDPMRGNGGSGVADIIDFAGSFWASSWRSNAGPGAFLDPDFLVVGCPTDRPCEGWSQKSQKPLTAVEQRTQFSMWCLLGAPLIIGSDIRNLDADALHTLSNTQAIAINQDPAALPPRRVVSKADHVVWVRNLENGDAAVAVLNLSNATKDLVVALDAVVCATCPRRVSVVDVWSSAPRTTHVDTISLKSVASHQTVLLRVTPQQ